MALNPNDLGSALYAASKAFDDVAVDLSNPAQLEIHRQNYWKAIATALVTYITANATVPALGLSAPNGAVVGVAKIT